MVKPPAKIEQRGCELMQISRRREDYALHRMAVAIDRVICGQSKEQKESAVKWVAVWQKVHASVLDKVKNCCACRS